jgi:hypothetical protein
MECNPITRRKDSLNLNLRRARIVSHHKREQRTAVSEQHSPALIGRINSVGKKSERERGTGELVFSFLQSQKSHFNLAQSPAS